MAEQEPTQTSPLDNLMAEVIANLPALVTEIAQPGNIWESNTIYIDKLKAAHKLIDSIKSGTGIVLIAVDPKGDPNKTHLFVANMDETEAMLRLSTAMNKFAKFNVEKQQKKRQITDDSDEDEQC